MEQHDKTMTVKGDVYIDGNVTSGTERRRSTPARATIYSAGYVTITARSCGKRSTPGSTAPATPANWNPNTEMWIIAAHGDDGSGNSVTFPNNATWEGGVYANKVIDLANNANVEGPIIGGSAIFSNNVTVKPFPVITTVPLGAPGNPNVYAQPNPPGGYSG